MSDYLSWVEIDSENLNHNLKSFQKIAGDNVKIMPVIKSNAYGHGIFEVAKILEESNVDYLGVVSGAEALFLRSKSITTPILVLSYFDTKHIKELIQQKIELVVYDIETLKIISEVSASNNIIAKVHIKVDTGTSRLGVLVEDAVEFVKECLEISMIEVKGIFTHFADSENTDWTFTNKQIDSFRNLLFELQREGIKIPISHAACSAAALSSAKTHFSLIRVGISIYGLWPSAENKKSVQKQFPDFELKPVLSWRTRIIQIKNLPKGSFVGYGCSYKLKKDSAIAILPIGYNEGYTRLLSNKGKVLYKGKECSIIGKICMNLVMIDITAIKDSKVGEIVTLIGSDGKSSISAEDIAKWTETINYEVVTRINSSLPRVII